MSTIKVVVIGNGMVGYKFCEKAVASPLADQLEITVFGEEPWVAYDRVHLSEYFSGSTVADLEMAPRSWYEENKVTLHTSDPIINIDRKAKIVYSHQGKELAYDKLVFATGSSAFVPPIPGVEKDGIFVYRTIEDLDQTIAYGKKAKQGVVIGGGLLGLEAAKAMMDMGVETTVVEFAPKLMPRQLDDQASKTLQSKLESLGLKILLSKNTSQFTGDGAVDGLEFADGTSIKTDIVVISAGIKPRDEVAKKIGLETGTRGGIVVNDSMQSEDPDIYVIGEAALHKGMIYGLVAPGYEMCDVVLSHLAGGQQQFTDVDMSTKLKLIGVDVASFGDCFGDHHEHESIVYQNKAKGVYKRINISKDGKRLLGGILVGEAEDYNMLLQTTLNSLPIPEEPERMIIKLSGGEDAFGGAGSLPDEAMICSCENVSKGDICNAVKDGATDLEALKTCTKAGTGCGGCMPMVKDLMVDTLKELGVSVKNVLCEHFDYSRTELLDIIKVKGYKTFQETVSAVGHGSGCEVCKPAVSSILASLNNHVVVTEETALDTNDRFLANIQRGGTYSVVPRIPGGEITAEKLIKIGEVAKKWELYVKITGGQRIDLLGAQLNDLPDIWEELVNAGFETGQAYGKSMRTVKSCVGSTWCRYGVQDSVGLAIDIENRYKGLRAPHKIKYAVSGCTRECAEAQNKDFGVIATEKGWALYVCGNGGSKPQHGPLFETDIDTQTLFKYMDRIAMFYIKTAEPLNRTATWFNKLEGGLAYLKDVVINDSLGICAELDAMMQHHVDTYHCEWKEVVENPELRAKFKHFVNVEDDSNNLEFVDNRGQKVPAPWSK